MTVLIQARGLRKSFGPTDALRGIDLDIQRGEVVAVMGPSGSGKSSLLHCLAGVVLPDSGTVSVGGTVITALSEARRSALRLKEFGFVFQFGQLLPDLTAVDNVTIPLLLGGMKRRQALTAARGWLDRLGLEVAADQLPGELSGGEAQRVAIARALVTQPSVLFADEPTGSLDSLAAENVLTAMLELVRKAGTTLVMITHDPRTAAYADREIIVRDGQLAATDRVGIK
ncbi:ABC transporter ATP-binding protein [Cryobacterium luteum]|uniref:ABC transporter ATP-binding protein n=1 Tax=Cryobacterium luteum TaxID=1424661 RepID=A0A1H8MK02_9MICO|nr:ABC transporter ATP-binding protein [Cryobacterium luteum]TFB95712.1 ABC transporter ATP-binding protein [Cryobacterium luteum]SEO17741.1 putative ABC transport system ATP-binding protein [Cryobacterium luteum]